MKLLKQTIRRTIYKSRLWNAFGKNPRELAYWEGNIEKIIKWYRSEEPWRGLQYPSEAEREERFDERKNAIMTYIATENRLATYLSDLWLAPDVFNGKKVADIGSGPLPTLLVLKDCERYCIDHLMNDFRRVGYPLEEFEDQVTFINAKSEVLPQKDAFFDVVLSRNALDHVDDFRATGREILRVLKPGGVLHILLNYHEPTKTETQVLSDELVQEVLGETGIRVVYSQEGIWGFRNGRTVLWSNLPDANLVPV